MGRGLQRDNFIDNSNKYGAATDQLTCRVDVVHSNNLPGNVLRGQTRLHLYPPTFQTLDHTLQPFNLQLL